MEKAAARREIKRRLRNLTPRQRHEASERIRQNLAALPEYQRAATVMLFVALPDEIETLPIIRDALAAGKRVVLPKVDTRHHTMEAHLIEDPDRDLAPGAMGILEPRDCPTVPHDQVDLVVVPARGFDRQGNRLGRGAGYYDRYMSRPGFRAVRCGVAHSLQVLDHLPHDPHDLPVDILVTEQGAMRFRRQH